MATPADKAHADSAQRTWNTPEAIARHKAMTPEQRIKKTAELSEQTARVARERGIDFESVLFEQLRVRTH